MCGRIAPDAAAPVQFLDRTYLLGHVTIDHHWANLGPAPGSSEKPRPGAIVHTRPGLLPIFYGVRILELGPGLFRPLTAVVESTDHESAVREFQDWYRERVDHWPETLRLPTQKLDMQDARRAFPDLTKIQEHVRVARATILTLKRAASTRATAAAATVSERAHCRIASSMAMPCALTRSE
jgi:hypothetical protein